MSLSIWQLILMIVPLVLGILLKGIIKKFVIWAVDVVCAIGFLFIVLMGGVAGFYVEQNLTGGSGPTGIALGIFGGIALGTLIFAVIFLFLSIDNSLQQIKANMNIKANVRVLTQKS